MFGIWALFGLLLLACGWLMPVHLRAVEPSVLSWAGKETPALTGRGFELLRSGDLGAAEMISREANRGNLPSAADLATAVQANAKQFPLAHGWGVADPNITSYFPEAPAPTDSFTDFAVREDNRTKALATLESSKNTGVQELLQTRSLNNTHVFAPSQSASGQAFDAAVVITGLLMAQEKLTGGLSNDVYSAAAQANHAGNTERLESTLLDFLSLGQRFNWGQLVVFVGKTDSAETLHDQADAARTAGDNLPALFAATETSRNPQVVTRYLHDFHQSGLKDLAAAFPFGEGAVRDILQHGQRIFESSPRQFAATHEPLATVVMLTADYCWVHPVLALIIKWALFLCGGFMLASALRLAKPAVTTLEEPLQVPGLHFARETLFALGFLLVALLVSEPFLVPEGTTPALPFRLRVPMVGAAIPTGANHTTSLMDKSKLIPMLLFFVLQGLLYISCIVKLAEIRRQRVGPAVKLKLLKNEEHLFDAGLYLGFLGTIVSFIITSIHAGQFSFMVAYSSTAFGILFVSFFKIFHLRPASRRFLLEAEAETVAEAANTAAPAAAHALSAS